MNIDALNQFVCVPIPTTLYARLATVQPHGVSGLIEYLAEDFLERTADLREESVPAKSGLHWDNLYLPDGTLVRTKYLGEYKQAEIKDGRIVWQKKVFGSLSQLARSMRGDTSNNAWKVLEVKRPGDAAWRLADFLRQ
jgi:hypothetical protein